MINCSHVILGFQKCSPRGSSVWLIEISKMYQDVLMIKLKKHLVCEGTPVPMFIFTRGHSMDLTVPLVKTANYHQVMVKTTGSCIPRTPLHWCAWFVPAGLHRGTPQSPSAAWWFRPVRLHVHHVFHVLSDMYFPENIIRCICSMCIDGAWFIMNNMMLYAFTYAYTLAIYIYICIHMDIYIYIYVHMYTATSWLDHQVLTPIKPKLSSPASWNQWQRVKSPALAGPVRSMLLGATWSPAWSAVARPVASWQ